MYIWNMEVVFLVLFLKAHDWNLYISISVAPFGWLYKYYIVFALYFAVYNEFAIAYGTSHFWRQYSINEIDSEISGRLANHQNRPS